MFAIQFAAADGGKPLFLAGSETLPYLVSLPAEGRQFPDETFAAAALKEAIEVNPRLAQRAHEIVRLW